MRIRNDRLVPLWVVFGCLAAVVGGCSRPPTPVPPVAATHPAATSRPTSPAPTRSPTSLPTATVLPEPSPTATPRPPTETPLPPTAAPPPAAAATGDTWIHPADGAVMVAVPAGEFAMGSTAEDHCAHLDEQPPHQVYLNPYWIDRTEVTNAQYRRCVEEKVCPAPAGCGWGEATFDDPSRQDHPVVCLPYAWAQTYCQWSGGRLPTEAEWEKAARGSDSRRYPWGDVFDPQRCNSSESGVEGTTVVGQHSPAGDSPYGAVDMAGNVWEWVTDWYDIEYYAGSPLRNPRGPLAGERRTLRGGSWYGDQCSARTSYRYYDVSDGTSPGVGFRCVLPSPP